MDFSVKRARDFLKTSDNVVYQMRETSKKLTDYRIYEPIRQSLMTLASSQFPNSIIDVHFFGSRVMGVATDQSDLDIFVEINGNYCSMYDVSQEHEQKYIKLASAVEKNNAWLVKERVLRAAIPIIICVYLPMKLDCDINIVHGLGNADSKLIRHLFDIQPEAVSLYHFVRMWMKVQEFKLFKGYTITLLVIYYLQTNSLMPSVENVQSGVYPKKIVSGWEVQFNDRRTLSSYDVDKIMGYLYKQHLPGFFKFYSKFNFDQVISTYYGRAMNTSTYKMQYPKFLLKGIFIAGPLNKGKSCGIADYGHKEKFIDFCKASSNFFDENEI